ncbi:PREDICTED: cadherin-related family member 5 isoform X1 [Chinchilla lanigera]|uniref:Cadherin-related family member 5 n=1 Tax=Chinchilla lanigera TaxID=34839 RepID=A0A8C2UQ34_CHILA|nr:PREDICTED: cadherin-related family member 5 isoform X1 [Chinchilla lanigera]
MGAWALLWAPLLLLLVLPGQPPGAAAQGQVCFVNKTLINIKENTNPGPLTNIFIPDGQHVTLGPSSTPSAFRILGDQLFLNMTPDYEENTMLEAHLECRRGSSVVTQLLVLVSVLDVNDNAPEFPFEVKNQDVAEDTKVNSIVIPESELKATDKDEEDVLFYTLQEVTLNASSFFSLEGVNRPALRLDRSLDFYQWQNMTFRLLVRDTQEENAEPSHTATATLVLHVLPADLRAPWFLPCSYSDGYVCIEAQYHGAIPTGHRLPSPLILRPGPIYAVDGDRGINARIIYSIVGGNVDNTFAIDANSGNLTMVKIVPAPTTFTLLIRGDQADQARYSVTQVTVEARSTPGSPPQFPQNLYRGFVAPGSGAGVAVRDASSPSQPLRIQAQDPSFPGFNSAITYRITNCSEFRMDGETVLTATALEREGVFYAEVEATNTVTGNTATAAVEIWVSEQAPPTTGPPEVPPSPEAGGTTRPSTSTATEVPSPSGTSQEPSSTRPGGATGPHPSSGTTPRPAAPTTPGRLPGVGASTTTRPATSGGVSAQTPKPGTSQPTTPRVAASSSPWPATPGGVSGQTPKPGTSQPTTPRVAASSSPWPATPGGVSPQTPKPGTSQPTPPWPSRSSPASGTTSNGPTTEESKPGSGPGDPRFSTVDMAVLGGVLGALLLLALIGLAVLLFKHYGHQLCCRPRKAADLQPHSFDNQAFLGDQEATKASAPGPKPGLTPAETLSAPLDPEPLSPEPPTPKAQAPEPPGPESPVAPSAAGDSPSAVRSILTKERRPEGGYKAVWFGEDIGAEADVVVLNTPEAGEGGDGDSEGSGEEDMGPDRGPSNGPGDSTYI